MSQRARSLVTVVALLSLPAASSFGAVSLYYSDGDAAPATTTVAAAGTFTVSVILGESAAADDVTGIDYQPQISANGSGDFRILSRTSTSAFVPYQGDGSAAIAPATLAPTNGGVDYGGDRNGAADLRGPATYTVATFSIQVIAGTPNGTYTLGFKPTTADYSAGAPNFTTTLFTSGGGLGSYTVNVPEPTTGLAATAVGLVGLRRRRIAR